METYTVSHIWVSHRNGGYVDDVYMYKNKEDAEKKADELHASWCCDNCACYADIDDDCDDDYDGPIIFKSYHECKDRDSRISVDSVVLDLDSKNKEICEMSYRV